MIEISTTYSLWWLLLIGVFALGLSALLYFKNAKEDFPLWAKIGLSFLRFSVLFILGFFLLSPMLKSRKTEVEKPIVLLAVDNSKSMVLAKDSTLIRSRNKRIIRTLQNKLADKFTVETYLFGSEFRKAKQADFNDVATNMSDVFYQIGMRYRYRNVGAVVFISDGIINEGTNAIYASRGFKFPIYCLGTGDSSVHADLAVSKVLNNKTEFVNNKFPLEVSILARKRAGTRAKLVVYHKGKVLVQKELAIKTNYELIKTVVYLQAKDEGMQSYNVVVKPFDGEQNQLNNKKNVVIEVLGTKKKVLLLYDSPNPDIAALKLSLAAGEEYKLTEMKAINFSGDFKKYNLILFHQIPNGSTYGRLLVKRAEESNIPIFFILGTKSSLADFNALHLGLSIVARKHSMLQAGAVVNKDFSSFVLGKGIKTELPQMPPLLVPFGSYKLAKNFNVLSWQRIGNITTKYPLVAVSEQSGNRKVFVLGEGLWRWRMFDFMKNKEHNNFDNFIMKLIRYASISRQHRHFYIQYKNRYKENEEVEFSAGFSNASYEYVNDADVQMKIYTADSMLYPYVFNVVGEGYQLDAGRFPAGKYHFVAQVNYHGKHFEQKGVFVVESLNIEAAELEANHQVLRKIANSSGGKYYEIASWQGLMKDLLHEKNIVNIEHSSVQYRALIKVWQIAILLILLLSIEWFVRKQMGSY